MFYPLQKGDKVAIVTPSRGGPGIFPHIYEPAIQTLQLLGLEVVEMPYTRSDNSFIFDHPEKRAEDINNAFADKSIRMIISSIGGDDCIRILPFLDEKVIKENPKIFMGFSDTTAVLTYLYKLGNPCYYGPSMMAGLAQYNELGEDYQEHIKHFFFDGLKDYQYAEYDQYTDGFPDWSQLYNAGKVNPMNQNKGWNRLQGEGIVTGELFGGCYEVIKMLVGTKHWLYNDERKNKVFFVEMSGDYHPPINEITWTLRNFAAQGIFSQINAFLWAKPATYSEVESLEIDEMIRVFFRDEMKNTTLPIITQMDFGHYYPQHIMPMGLNLQIDCGFKKIFIN